MFSTFPPYLKKTGKKFSGVDDGTHIPASRELDEFFSNWDDDFE